MAENAEPIDPKLVRELADILSDTGLTEIEVERGDLKIRVARQVTVAAAPAVQAAVAPMPMAASTPLPSAAAESAGPAPVDGEAVKSPMVGTVYLQAKPGDEPFARVGAKVSAGQTLLIIEAMKTMNAIPAPRDGVIRAVLVANEQPVEYGEPLVVLE